MQNTCDEANRTIIRIWTSARNKRYPGQNVGHIDIQTTTPAGFYSLWPSEQGKNNGTGFFKPIGHEFKADYAADEKAEGRPPEVTVCLYSLDGEKMGERFRQVEADPEFKGWTLLGNNVLLNKGNAHSCSSLAYELLKKGGIYELISAIFSTRASSVVSPDDLVIAVTQAKQAEREKYPETRNFVYANETVIAEPSKGCCIL